LSMHLEGAPEGASDGLGVGVLSPQRELATVQTSLNVKRWDAEQTTWLAGKFERWGNLPPAKPDSAFTPRHFAAYSVAPYSETQEENCNAVVQQGWVWLLGGIAGTTMSTKFSASNGRVGVGTSNGANTWTTTYLIGDTGVASTTSYYQLVSGAPVITTSSGPATLVFSASFGTGVANFAWAEFGTDNGTTSGVYLNGLAGGFALFNRGISNQGTKASGQTWTATQTISMGYPDSAGIVGAVS
jgi:hypothetical protein